jgi:hypothetical protein
MTRTSQRQLWFATLILAGASAFISACGPQDETVMAAKVVAQPAAATLDQPRVARTTAKTSPQKTKAVPAPALVPAPMLVGEAPSAAATHPITGAVQRIEPIVDLESGGTVSGYRVQVQIDGGALRTFEPTLVDGLKVGDRVRVEQGHLRRV